MRQRIGRSSIDRVITRVSWDQQRTTCSLPSPLEGEGQLLKRSAEKQGEGVPPALANDPSTATPPHPDFLDKRENLSLSLKGRGRLLRLTPSTLSPATVIGRMWRTPCFAAVLLLLATSATAQDSSSPLFDGETLNGWTTLDGKPVTQGWEVVDGTIHLQATDERSGHIITNRDVGNFILSFDFKIAPGGNSGIKYRVQDINGNMLGCEYQIYDDAHPDKPVPPQGSTGSLYDVYEPVANKPLNPAGEYNSAKIVVRDYVIEHWLNGRLLMSALVGSQEWHCRIANSKFHDDPGFGLNRFGRLMLTDHGSEVWYRNIEFEELPTRPAPLLASRVCGSPPVVAGGDCPTPVRTRRVVGNSMVTHNRTSARLHSRTRGGCRVRRSRR